MKRVVAVHQPNFFPWLGYFDKIARSDIFLIMDNVQFPRTNRGTWSNRVKLLIDNKASWFTMPVIRGYHGFRDICHMRIDNSKPWREKLLRVISLTYARAPFFKEIFPIIEPLIMNRTESLAEYNTAVIESLAGELEIGPHKIILGSSLGVEGRATDLLIAMVKAVGGTAYLCGGGSAGYIEEEKFPAAGLELLYQGFRHPEYAQDGLKMFVPGLSIIDTLFNTGIRGTRGLIGY